MIRTAALAALLATPLSAADFVFCWQGANGYRLDGTMTVPDALLSKPHITEDHVSAFAITGTRDGIPLGQWSLADLTDRTSWTLNFDPAAMMFPTGGVSWSATGQEWNANGGVSDCGTPGFGFNSGSGGQDVCIDGRYHFESSIFEATPFPVYRAGALGACSGTPLLGALGRTPRAAS